MGLVISNEIVDSSGMSEKELTVAIIIMLFQQHKISINKAAALAGMPLPEFENELAQREISVHHEVTDLAMEQQIDPLAKMKSSPFIGCFEAEADLAVNAEVIMQSIIKEK